jgi:Protein of unknown function (DUF4012)
MPPQRAPSGLLGAAAVLLTLGGALLWLVMLAGPLRVATGILEARDHLSTSERLLSEGTFRRVKYETFAAGASAHRAQVGLEGHSPLFDLATLVPEVRDGMKEVPHLVAATAHSARAAEEALSIGLNLLRGENKLIAPDPEGTGKIIVLERVEEIGDAVTRARLEVVAARDELAAIDLGNLPERVRRDVTSGIARAEQTRELLGRTADGFAILPGILGGDGPRTYLLGFQNSAELRGPGGAMLQIRCLTMDEGKPTIPTKDTRAPSTDSAVTDDPCLGTVYKVDEKRHQVDIPLPEDAWYVREIEDAQRFGNANWSPDWPLSARLTVAYASASEKTFPHIDGVIGIDPLAVRNLMPGVGPFKIYTGNQISSGRVVNFLLSKAYSSFPIPQERRYVLGQVVEKFFRRLFKPKRPTDVVDGLGHSLVNKHVQIWMADPEEQAFMKEMKWSGRIAHARNRDYLYVVEQNVGGNKLDYAATQRDVMNIDLSNSGATVSTNVTVHNGIELPQPRWVLGDSKSAHRPMMNIYVPRRAHLLEADVSGTLCTTMDRLCNGRLDTPAPAVWSENRPPEHEERGKKVWSATMQIPVNEDGTFGVVYEVPDVVKTRGDTKVYRLVIQHQPKVRPEELAIRLQVPEGASNIHAVGFTRNGRTLTYERPLVEDTTLEVSWQS